MIELAQFAQSKVQIHDKCIPHSRYCYTTSAAGELIAHIFALRAHFESRLISEKTKQGLEAAKPRGTKLGRPRALNNARDTHAKEIFSQGKTANEITSVLNVSRSTVFRIKREIALQA